jgi:hypothetical protein
MFRNWISFNLQHVQFSISESIFTPARIAAKNKIVHIVALVGPDASAYPHERCVAIEALG